MCFTCGKHACLIHIVCAPLFTAYVKARVLFSEIGLVRTISVCFLQRSVSFADRFDSVIVKIRLELVCDNWYDISYKKLF